MLIRSQDKELMYFTKDIDAIYINDNGYMSRIMPYEYNEPTMWDIKTKNYCLGWYSSKEKALKVLDMIQKAYVEQQKDFQDRLLSMLNEYGDQELIKFMSPDTYVFQMPEDTEVIIDE